MRVNTRMTKSAMACAAAAVLPCGIARAELVVPPYHSNPSAFVKVYLDFDGDAATTWNGNTTGPTPAYDVDGNALDFTPAELTNINDVWQRVSEKFSPFNVNVTTVDPGNRNDFETVHVVIGGDGAWTGVSAGGIAQVGSFFSSTFENKVFVFSKRLLNGLPKRVGEASSHETGHSIGLVHQSLYGQFGQLIAEYNPGNALKAPVMGRSYESERGLWWLGTTYGPNTTQDDVDWITQPNIRIGYRDDDHGNTIAAATLLDDEVPQVLGNGIIERRSDVDMFIFDTLAGDVSFRVDVAPFGAMLDATLALYDLQGGLLAQSATFTLSETLSMTLSAGSYGVAVSGAGNYGDLGQYFLSGTIVAIPEPAAGVLLVIMMPLLGRRQRHR